MRALSSLGIGFSLVSGFLLLAVVAELYYLYWWKKRVSNRNLEEHDKSPARELLYFLCWKKPSSLSTTALNPQETCSSVNTAYGSDDAHLHSSSSKDFLPPFSGEGESLEAELMRIQSLPGHPRYLFTIKEETKEDLESESVRSRNGSRGNLLLSPETPFMTPLSSPPFFTPPLSPMDFYCQNGFNPLFDSSRNDDFSIRVRSSPPSKLKFLKDAEEKLYKRKLMEGAFKAQRKIGVFVEKLAKQNSSVPTIAGPDVSSHSCAEGKMDPSLLSLLGK